MKAQMKKYHVTYKLWNSDTWKCEFFEATCDTDARFTARMIFREAIYHKMGCGLSLIDFYGNYIDL